MFDVSKSAAIFAAFVWSGLVAVIFVAAATIGAEIHAPFKTWLASTFMHHWIGKGIIAMVIFFLGGFILAITLPRQRASAHLAWLLFVVTVLASCAIIGFYIDHTFGAH